MKIDKNKIIKSKYFKVWDIFILILVVIAIGMLIHSYFLVTPELLRQYDTYNFIISAIFLFDVIMRSFLFGKKYIYSAEIVIDVLACLDIFSPALKAVRGIKTARMARIARLLRILRMLRIFRGIKAVKYIGKSEIEMKMFTTFSIFAILSFLFLSLFVSSYIKDKFYGLITETYTTDIKNAILNAMSGNEFKEDIFIRDLKEFNKTRVLLSYKLDINGNIYKKNLLPRQKIKDDYFDDDIITINLKKSSVVFANKKLRYYMSNVEFFILISSLPILLIMIFLIFVLLSKYYTAPMEKIIDVVSAYEEGRNFTDIDYTSTDSMQVLKAVYNDAIKSHAEIKKYCQDLINYYNQNVNTQ